MFGSISGLYWIPWIYLSIDDNNKCFEYFNSITEFKVEIWAKFAPCCFNYSRFFAIILCY